MRILPEDVAIEYDDNVEWFLPELRSIMRDREPAEDLGIRRLIEFPEAVSRRPRPERHGSERWHRDPDLPDAA